jgi:hypothetical protein
MMRKAAVGSLILVIGCGEGPKHLPKSDYQHGKAAFEMLEQFEKASSGSLPRIEESGSFLLAAAEQMDAMGTRNSSNGLRIALTNYEESINASATAKYDLVLAETAVKLAQAKGVPSEELFSRPRCVSRPERRIVCPGNLVKCFN